jgi:hypothetical protein
MGSLLSFPLLCFLNDFITEEAGIERGKKLINGDDIVARTSPEAIARWKNLAPKVGLHLSQGKNFIDPDFCTVNSQLFWKGSVQHTGKVSLSTRWGKTLSRCWAESQFYYGTDPELEREFIRRNLVPLRKTPRSLRVPVTHGGLALVWGELTTDQKRRSVEVYLHEYLFRFSKSEKVVGRDDIRALLVPVGFFTDEEMLLAGGELPEGVEELLALGSLDIKANDSPIEEDLSFASVSKTMRLARNCSERMVNQLRERDPSLFPPLGTMRARVVFVEAKKVGYIKSRTIELCLSQLQTYIDAHQHLKDEDECFAEILSEFHEDHDPLFGTFFSMDSEMVEAIALTDAQPPDSARCFDPGGETKELGATGSTRDSVGNFNTLSCLYGEHIPGGALLALPPDVVHRLDGPEYERYQNLLPGIESRIMSSEGRQDPYLVHLVRQVFDSSAQLNASEDVEGPDGFLSTTVEKGE